MDLPNEAPFAALKRTSTLGALSKLHRLSVLGGPAAETGADKQAGRHMEGSLPNFSNRNPTCHFEGRANSPGALLWSLGWLDWRAEGSAY